MFNRAKGKIVGMAVGNNVTRAAKGAGGFAGGIDPCPEPVRYNELTNSGVIYGLGFFAFNRLAVNFLTTNLLQRVGNGLHGAAGVISAVAVA